MSFSRELRGKASARWEACYRHPFLRELGEGTLDSAAFRFYLLQDNLYLISYAKVFALIALKADTVELTSRAAAMQDSILNVERRLHREYMASFGITDEQAEAAKPSLYHKAYVANMLAAGQTGGAAELLASVLPCAWSYADFGERLARDYAGKLEGNFYRSWIECYSGAEYTESFQWIFDELDRLAGGKNELERKKLEEIFADSIEFEYLFWEMAYKQQMSY